MRPKQDDVPFEKPVSGHRCSYYDSGEHLRTKHQLARTESGRKFEKWALGLIPISSTSTILDAGCGWGRFTWPLIQEYHLSPSNVVCADLSLGMLQTASQEALQRGNVPFFVVSSIEALPFQTNLFTGVMANHVLYHLNDISQGVYELSRVVRQNGWLIATTNSDKIQVPVIELHYRALDQLGIAYILEGPSPFSMESGDTILRQWFGQVERFYFEDEVRYGDANEFIRQYVTMGRYRNILARDDVEIAVKQRLPEVVRELAQGIIQEQGILRSPVLMGAFVCTEPVVL